MSVILYKHVDDKVVLLRANKSTEPEVNLQRCLANDAVLTKQTEDFCTILPYLCILVINKEPEIEFCVKNCVNLRRHSENSPRYVPRAWRPSMYFACSV